MHISDIEITDIFNTNNIDNNTSILILKNITENYLIPTDKEYIYNIDINKIYNNIENVIPYILNFIPIGQVYLENCKDKITILLANEKIIASTKNYEKLTDNIWVGIIRKDKRISRSLGTIYSTTKPNMLIPVFPKSLLIKLKDVDNKDIYKNIYTHKSYNKMGLNVYSFNMDRNYIKMIDISGEVSDMCISSLNSSLSKHKKNITNKKNNNSNYNNSNYYKNMNNNRKIYYSAQGGIKTNSNCISGKETINKFSIDDCNAIKDTKVIKHSNKMNNNIILKESDEPWFLNENIVGDAINSDSPHKITGINNGNKPLIGNVYGDTDEINSPFKSDCVRGNNIGYSRNDKNKKCFNIENYSNTNDKCNTLNNIIILAIAIFIIYSICKRSKRLSL